MSKPDFTLKFIKDSGELRQFSARLVSLPAFAFDIETIDWWNRQRERIALIQIAYRVEDKIRVVIIDALAPLDFNLLRSPLENSSITKIIHNANFDAVRLREHYDLRMTSVFDTMVAARRDGERKYSLQAQAEIHLAIRLDKAARTSDWSRRPLDARQLHYAALDPYVTLLLYEHQLRRRLAGDYRLIPPIDSVQHRLPLDASPPPVESAVESLPKPVKEFSLPIDLTEVAAALLGIITELPSRYSPDGIAASVGAERVGLAGWIIDRRLGRDAEPDEDTVKMAVVDLLASRLITMTATRRLAASQKGFRYWQSIK